MSAVSFGNTTLRRLRQKAPKFKARLDYTARLCQGEGVGERDRGKRNREGGREIERKEMKKEKRKSEHLCWLEKLN